MADFVAVIRRTVDGLSDNVPEMRAKVYEKARGAVRRQLEGMKPRPSDEMINRQMVKLEAAITEVEDDYAEALPALDERESVAAAGVAVAAGAAGYAMPDEQAPSDRPARDDEYEHAEPVEEVPAVAEPQQQVEPEHVPEREEIPEAEALPAATPYQEEMPATAAQDEEALWQTSEPYEAPAAEVADREESAFEEPQEPSPLQPLEDEAPGVPPEDVFPQDSTATAYTQYAEEVEPETQWQEQANGTDEVARDYSAAEPEHAAEAAGLEPTEGAPEEAALPADDFAEQDASAKPILDDMPEPHAPGSEWTEHEVAEQDTAAETGISHPAQWEEAESAVEGDAYGSPEPEETYPAAGESEARLTPANDWAEPVAAEPVAHEATPADETHYGEAAWEQPEATVEAPSVYTDETPRQWSPEPAQGAAPSDWELPEWNDPAPVAASAHSEPVWTEVAEEVAISDPVPDLAAYMPAEGDVPARVDATGSESASGEPSHSWAWDESDPFAQTNEQPAETSEPAISDWSWPVEKVAAAGSETGAASAGDWNDVDTLFDHSGTAAAAGAAGVLAASEDVPARPISYRAEPKRSVFNLKTLGMVAALLLVLGGGGYAYWMNRDTVNSWVSGLLDAPTPPAPEQSGVEPTAPADGQATPGTQTPADDDIASLDAGTGKFTQRLNGDGTEVDEGAAPLPAGLATDQEGRSVAAQTEAGGSVQAGSETASANPPQPVPPANEQTPPPTAGAQVHASAQKMFLYEERLGQSAPTAIEGSVSWSVKEESPGNDAKPEPVIQGQITVPERSLTALMTIKRNADPSLPASHVIEFVFSLPETFEGGSIENVQRVAMKRSEQDRGDPLIAVPAKITDDFHMIALNDFPEAAATNTELLRSRSWLDIPLTYRNGRRALLTLEKGQAGTDAFTKAMQGWALATTPNQAAQ